MPVCEVRESEVFLMWTVTCDYVKGILTYFVENKETRERKGQFDCEPWAREFANELNKEKK